MRKIGLSALLAFLLVISCIASSFSQTKKVIAATSNKVDIRVGQELHKGTWNINLSLNPDVFDVFVKKSGTTVTFITDKDSVRYDVKPGDYHAFVILLNGKDSAFTAIKGILDVPRAVFPQAYQKAHREKTFVEIPRVYELMNVVMALTAEGKKDNGMIRKSEPYYAEVMKWFEPFSKEPVVAEVNAEIVNPDNYHSTKMDAYAFEFQRKKIVKSPIYDRIGFSNANNIGALLPGLQAFADKSKFLDFYAKHQPYYNKLIGNYRDSVGVADMQKWLVRNFPSTRYDSFKIIFSPLVSANQSATWFDYDGFREAQAHVNYPFRRKNSQPTLSEKALLVADGNIVFTELNHAFINPESEKPAYAARIEKAFTNMATWNDPNKPAKYYNNPYASFNEYMNWALVCIRYVDFAPENEQVQLIQETEKKLVESRGFLRFAEFDQFLVQLYKNRKPGQVMADLYPEIVGWFEKNQ
ncbi:DUF4932 domain-containing protein [Dyadobacter luticola]|uniref:DUF4932 domain-containing protein n=1 Tax=Dyadobacter luticola TaxID=1979387 RepID=A0A5R9KZK1_9BACT|nr:DUF4932 domain-containing protein [Dyadobacter luticola]TLV01517.1 DUF4932 domain-containing protein [Dyadobacter luticola]